MTGISFTEIFFREKRAKLCQDINDANEGMGKQKLMRVIRLNETESFISLSPMFLCDNNGM